MLLVVFLSLSVEERAAKLLAQRPLVQTREAGEQERCEWRQQPRGAKEVGYLAHERHVAAATRLETVSVSQPLVSTRRNTLPVVEDEAAGFWVRRRVTGHGHGAKEPRAAAETHAHAEACQYERYCHERQHQSRREHDLQNQSASDDGKASPL